MNLNTILSAAHCTHGRDQTDFQILVGQTNRTNAEEFLVSVAQVREHEEYDDWTLDHDMVILKLSTNLVEGPYVRRATLPPPSDYVQPGYEGVVSGFGKLKRDSWNFK